jgi:hypothetical protein
MTLRPEYALGHSPYNPFLFAAVGEERNGATLTVQSALTRLGFDPWREAARLSGLPRDTAAGALAVSIAMLPEGDWNASDSEAIATRLVTWLPAPGAAAAVPAVEAGRSEGNKIKTIERIDRIERIETMKPGFAATVAWSVLAAALLFFAMNFFSSNNLETGQGEAAGESTQQ